MAEILTDNWHLYPPPPHPHPHNNMNGFISACQLSIECIAQLWKSALFEYDLARSPIFLVPGQHFFFVFVFYLHYIA